MNEGVYNNYISEVTVFRQLQNVIDNSRIAQRDFRLTLLRYAV